MKRTDIRAAAAFVCLLAVHADAALAGDVPDVGAGTVLGCESKDPVTGKPGRFQVGDQVSVSVKGRGLLRTGGYDEEVRFFAEGGKVVVTKMGWNDTGAPWNGAPGAVATLKNERGQEMMFGTEWLQPFDASIRYDSVAERAAGLSGKTSKPESGYDPIPDEVKTQIARRELEEEADEEGRADRERSQFFVGEVVSGKKTTRYGELHRSPWQGWDATRVITEKRQGFFGTKETKVRQLIRFDADGNVKRIVEKPMP